MENLQLVFPEIFLSLSIMFLLILGVFKKNSSNLIFNLTILSLIIVAALILNISSEDETSIFNASYKIDNLSSFMKILTILSAIFVMLTSSKYLKLRYNNKFTTYKNLLGKTRSNSKIELKPFETLWLSN